MNHLHHQYKRGCAVQSKHVFSTGEAVQYKQVDHQVLGIKFQYRGGGEGITLKYFPRWGVT